MLNDDEDQRYRDRIEVIEREPRSFLTSRAGHYASKPIDERKRESERERVGRRAGGG